MCSKLCASPPPGMKLHYRLTGDVGGGGGGGSEGRPRVFREHTQNTHPPVPGVFPRIAKVGRRSQSRTITTRHRRRGPLKRCPSSPRAQSSRSRAKPNAAAPDWFLTWSVSESVTNGCKASPRLPAAIESIRSQSGVLLHEQLQNSYIVLKLNVDGVPTTFCLSASPAETAVSLTTSHLAPPASAEFP